MFPRDISHILFLVLILFSFPVNAKVIVQCDRPSAPEFDHTQTPHLEAVIASNELIKQYGVEAQAYIKCLQRVIISEKDDILATIKSYRKENAQFRDAYINK